MCRSNDFFAGCRTTGGGSASPVTVTTLDALKTAVTGSTAKVVIISGSITGNEVVKVGPNTSVLGKSGASKYCPHTSLKHKIKEIKL